MVQQCYCKDPKYITDDERGEVVCKQCGVIVESNIYTEDVNSGVENTYSNKLAAGTNLGTDKVKHVSRRIQYTHRQNTVQIIMYHAITAMCDHMRVPEIIRDEAINYGRRAINEKMTRGRRVDNVSAACIMLACRTHGRIITEKEMFSNNAISRKSTRRIYRDMKMKWNIKQRDMKKEIMGLVNRICDNSKLSYKTRTRALNVLRKHYDEYIGIHPSVCAAGLVLLKCDENVSQKEICNSVGVTEVSVRSFVRRHRKRKNINKV